MIHGSIATERKYKENGYSIYSLKDYRPDAEALVKDLRSKGYRAIAMEYSTAIRGYHSYAVWYKAF